MSYINTGQHAHTAHTAHTVNTVNTEDTAKTDGGTILSGEISG